MPELVIVGSMALDDIKTPFGEVKGALGGAATYASVAASLFAKTGVVAVVGKDFPEQHLQFLKERKVDLSGVKVAEGKTFRWSGYYEYDMNHAHTLDTQLNAFAEFKPELTPEFKKTGYLFLANIDPELQLSVLEQAENPRLVGLDTMNYWIENKKKQLREVISKVDVLFLNEGEARQYCNTPNLVKAARMLQEEGPRTVVIKKGEHGALLFNHEDYFAAPGYPLEKVVDPTGAGDSFAGGFMGYAAMDGVGLEKMDVRRAVMYGSAAASYDAEHFGLNKLREITRNDIDERFKRFRDMTFFD